ncbi:glycosyltransferase [candidate division KSB1 bacterium]|nr:glycosyltransferase [candidate division KSB1 bacterium]
MKKVLMLCYYFPPLGLAGTQRAAKFARYLPEFGWQPTVVTVKPIAYWAQDPTLLQETATTRVIRTESWDPQRWLARLRPSQPAGPVAGSSTGVLSFVNEHLLPLIVQPDAKIGWKGAVLRTVNRLMREESFDALFSTSPPHSAQLIAAEIKRRTALPWVADFRDSWSGSAVVREPTPWHRRVNLRNQRRVARLADAVIAVTPTIQRQMQALGARQCLYLPNGFDSADFPVPRRRVDNRFVLCHCGTITEFSRPDTLLQAVKRLKQLRPDTAARLVLRFVGHDLTGKLNEWIAENGLHSQVKRCGYLPHRQALQELVDADALLLIARGRADAAFVPGKTFEYLGSKKPILVISDVPDTLDLLNGLPHVRSAATGDVENIVRLLGELLAAKVRVDDAADLSRYERRYQTQELARVFDRCSDAP